MSRRKIHSVIYVPGLGDKRVAGQRFAIKQWRWQGMEPYLFRIDWQSDEALQIKLDRLLRLIDRLHDDGRDVSLVGASAGASIVLMAYARRPHRIRGVACICGKILRPEGVSEYTYRTNPPFREAMDRLPAELDRLGPKERRRILSARAMADESVPPADSVLEGVELHSFPVAGHFVGIAYGLTAGSFRIMRFLRSCRQSASPATGDV